LSVFVALLDTGRAGSLQIAPKIAMRTTQRYLPDTNVLVTRFLSDQGVAELTDFMPVNTENEKPTNEIIRNVCVIRGEIAFSVTCAPRFDYARSTHSTSYFEHRIAFHPETSGIEPMMICGSVTILVREADVGSP
jgi:GH15 family glucan-1,4-alpha-glucosidase